MKRLGPLCPDQPQTEDRNLRKHREKRIIAEWQHQPKREEEHGHTELLGVRGWGRLSSKGHTGQFLHVELTWAYYGLCRDSDRVGNRRAKKP